MYAVVGPALTSTWKDLCCSPAVDLLNESFERLCSGKCRVSRYMIEVSLALADGLWKEEDVSSDFTALELTCRR